MANQQVVIEQGHDPCGGQVGPTDLLLPQLVAGLAVAGGRGGVEEDSGETQGQLELGRERGGGRGEGEEGRIETRGARRSWKEDWMRKPLCRV